MRRLTYLIACSVDGFIAADDGSLDAFATDPAYLEELLALYPETCPGHLRDALGVHGDNQHFDTVIMGGATYVGGQALGVTSPYPTLEQYVVSTTVPTDVDEAVTVVRDDLRGLVGQLKQNDSGKDIWLAGGASLAGSMRDAGLIDSVVLKVNPVVLGHGIPLFAGEAPWALALEHRETRTLPGGVNVLSFEVRRG